MNAVDWSQRMDCQGDVDQVPALLRQLWSGEGSFRALDELYERLAPDHSIAPCVAVRDATPAAVPFLARLAQDERTPQRSAVLQLLMYIVDATDEGPVEACFGVWPYSWLRNCGRALSKTRVEEWFKFLDTCQNRDQRRDVLRLLAIAGRFDTGELLLWLWQSVLDASDAELLTERLISLAYATREGPWMVLGDDIEEWAVPLKNWLKERHHSCTEQTTHAVDIALQHLPDWIDADTVEALSSLIHEQSPPG